MATSWFTQQGVHKIGQLLLSTVPPSCANKPLRIEGTTFQFTSMQSAFESSLLNSGNTIQLRSLDLYNEDAVLNQNVSLTLQGGYDCDFIVNPGHTTLHGSLTITEGAVTIDKLEIAGKYVP